MQETLGLLGKLAEGLERSADPFSQENARLAALPREVLPLHNPTPRLALAPGVWLDYQPEAGVETRVGAAEGVEAGVRFQVESIGSSKWYSFSYEIPAEALRSKRYLGQILRCSSEGPARFRLCLRYALPEGIRDVFARQVCVLTGFEKSGASNENVMQDELVFVPIDASLAAQAQGAEVLLFFEGRSFDVTLHAIEAMVV